MYAADLPSGGPAYPEATPGARLTYMPTDRLTVRAAIFNGDPAGPGPGNPVERDPFGLAFRVNDPPFLIAEITYSYNQKKPESSRGNPTQEGIGWSSGIMPADQQVLPGTIKIGAWMYTGNVPDQLFGAGGLPVPSGVSPQHGGDYAAYAILDQMLWRIPGTDDRGLSLFLRASAAPSDRNLVDVYADGGLTFKGLLSSRPNDTAGLALAYGRISPQAAARDREFAALAGTPMPVRDFEAALELTYQMQLADNWSVQPDMQYIVHPGGNMPNPLDPSGASRIRMR